MATTTAIILDTRRKKKNGKYPVKLRVIDNRITKDYPTIFELSEADFKKLSAPRISESLQEMRKNLQEIESSVEASIHQMEPFSFADFEKEYAGHKYIKIKKRKADSQIVVLDSDGFDYAPYLKRFSIFEVRHHAPSCLSSVFLNYIKKLLQQGRIGSAINYQRTYRSLEMFRGNSLLQEVTPAYLYQYEAWMLSKGASKTTVGIVLRPLRAIFNEAIDEGLIRKEKCYPFGRRKYQIPASRNLKKALSQDDLKKIFYYQPNCQRQALAKAYWLFCYLANGMNVKDFIHLKWKNVQGEYLIFERAKTEKSTQADQRPITVYLTEDLLEILNSYGTKDRHSNEFVFPIMQRNLNSLQQFDLLHDTRKMINRAMAEIGTELNIEKKITTIVTRHSFSTQMKRAGASTEFIQEALGHTSKKTTENYLDSFEKEVKKEFAAKLTAFKDGDDYKL